MEFMIALVATFAIYVNAELKRIRRRRADIAQFYASK